MLKAVYDDRVFLVVEFVIMSSGITGTLVANEVLHSILQYVYVSSEGSQGVERRAHKL